MKKTSVRLPEDVETFLDRAEQGGVTRTSIIVRAMRSLMDSEYGKIVARLAEADSGRAEWVDNDELIPWVQRQSAT